MHESVQCRGKKSRFGPEDSNVIGNHYRKEDSKALFSLIKGSTEIEKRGRKGSTHIGWPNRAIEDMQKKGGLPLRKGWERY